MPTASGAEQRLFVEGDEIAYSRGGVIAELRDPFLQVKLLENQRETQCTKSFNMTNSGI